jgi:steroid 5-alpha reductase family enzyme
MVTPGRHAGQIKWAGTVQFIALGFLPVAVLAVFGLGIYLLVRHNVPLQWLGVVVVLVWGSRLIAQIAGRRRRRGSRGASG